MTFSRKVTNHCDAKYNDGNGWIIMIIVKMFVLIAIRIYIIWFFYYFQCTLLLLPVQITSSSNTLLMHVWRDCVDFSVVLVLGGPIYLWFAQTPKDLCQDSFTSTYQYTYRVYNTYLLLFVSSSSKYTTVQYTSSICSMIASWEWLSESCKAHPKSQRNNSNEIKK